VRVSGRRLVDTRFGQVHVRTWHADRPGRPLVLLHMSPRSSRMWADLQPLVQRPTYAPDRLGYGQSDEPPRDLALEDYARSTLDAIEGLGLRDFDVLGMHTGSLEALELAHQAPGRMQRCGIVGIPVFTADEKRAMAGYSSQRLVPAEDGSHLLPAWRARFQYREPPFDLSDVQRRYVDYLCSPDPGAAYRAVFDYDAEARLRACGVPLTAFVPRDDIYEVSRRSRALLPDGAVVVDLPDMNVDLFRQPARVIARAPAFFAD
jgi:pimeloyl-ACP methyl ester carboxylesterase